MTAPDYSKAPLLRQDIFSFLCDEPHMDQVAGKLWKQKVFSVDDLINADRESLNLTALQAKRLNVVLRRYHLPLIR